MTTNEIRIEKLIKRSVCKRAKKSGKSVYVARLVDIDQTGKQREICREKRTRIEAKEELQDLEEKYNTWGASAFSAEKFTFNHLADRFEKDCVKEAVFNDGVKVSGYKSSNSVKSYLKTLRAHLGGRELGKINYNDIKIFRGKTTFDRFGKNETQNNFRAKPSKLRK